MQEFFDKIRDLDLVTEISEHVDLKKSGVSYRGCCPFHTENTGSFMVNPAKGIYKCFGCGKGGNNPASFLMELKGLTWWDACVELAKKNQIEIPNKKERTDEEEHEYKKYEAIKVVNKFAMEFFEEQLRKNEKAIKYALSRWSSETIALFNIGYAPAGNELYKTAMMKGYKTDLLLEADLIKVSTRNDGTYYDTFRDRIMFPMCDKYGRPVGFSGRVMPGAKKDLPKYVNTKENDIFQKGRMFFGFHMAQASIRKEEFAYLVEGHPDVVRLHEINQTNTIATSGTALTDDQVRILKGLVKSVNIIGDTDNAGKKAIKRSAEMLIKAGLFVNVVKLPEPEGEEKHDPDSFFTDEQIFKEYVQGDNIPDYIMMKAHEWQKKANNPDFKKRAIDEITDLISFLPDTVHGMYIEQLGKIIPNNRVWTQALKAVMKEKQPVEKESGIPEHVKLADFEKYGFYADHNCYYFRGRGGTTRGSNFVMKPLFHIVSVSNAKRLYEITNEYDYTCVIELLQKDLVTLSRFRERIEGLGNFLWEAQEGELNKLKRYLYENTESCLEITQLGWQKFGFWAWGNGIYNGSFQKSDAHGIVKYDEKNFYLPAFSDVYEGEDGLFTAERRFVHSDYPGISLNDYTVKLIRVFGDNAKFGICFYLATIFRDYIVRKFNFYPILNLFGPKGAGKTELAVSLLQFFGRQPKGPNINNTSKAALADHVAMSCNALCHIDEYKNNLEFEKIEFLKGLWDGTGRTRMNMDKDKKKETTAVDSGIIISGQEMPTADIALFSRLVYLTFSKTSYNDQEKKDFNELKDVEKKGLTHITHEILSHRDYLIKHFMDNYDRAATDLQNDLNESIEDRIFKNWLIPIAAYRTLKEKITLPFTYDELIKDASVQISIQNRETRKSNEITAFWNIVLYLFEDHLIHEGGDFKIEFNQTKIFTDELKMDLNDSIDIIYIHYGKIMPLYSKIGKQIGEKILPRESMDYYLKNHTSYLGKKKKKMNVIDEHGNKKRIVDNGSERLEFKACYVYAFKYSEIGISLHSESEEKQNEPESDNKNDLPF